MAEPTTNAAADAPNPLMNILKDIELPEPISWWPPAPGWWVLAALALALVFWIGRTLIARHRLGAYRREALTALTTSHQNFSQDGDSAAYVESVTSLLRRVAIHVSGREAVARLTGERWITHLNSLTSKPLPLSTANSLESALYQPGGEVQVDEFHPHIMEWVDGLTGTATVKADA